MNQSQLIEKVARETELNQAAAGQAVKAMVKAILDLFRARSADIPNSCIVFPGRFGSGEP
jgi:nucleoid DNA-binding protein